MEWLVRMGSDGLCGAVSFLLDVRSVPSGEGVLKKTELEQLRPYKVCGMLTVKSQHRKRGDLPG